MRLLATSSPPLILNSRHNISPRLGKQLILELHIRVENLEVVQELPGGVVLRKALPLD
jgi:hypothetical protein